MPTFHYVAKRGPQDVLEGELEAESRAGVLNHLAGLGYIPVRIQEGVAAARKETVTGARPVTVRGRRVPVRYLNQFTRQFASLVRSQVPMLRTLGILKDQTTRPGLRHVIASVEEAIRQGDTLSAALAKHPQVFSPLYINLTRSGELAGTLEGVLERLAAQAERDEALRAKVQAALVYPMFVGVVGLGSVIFLMTFVMPRLMKLFQGFGGRLPLPTRILLAMTYACQQPLTWGLLVVVVVGVVVIVRSRQELCRAWGDRLSLQAPVLGRLVRQLELSRFCRSFGLLLDHGIPILQATEVALAVVNNRVIRRALEGLPAHLKEGNALADGLKGLAIATPFAVHTIAVGEEGGRVAEALTEVANYYEREGERLLQVLASLLEPLMIVGVGGVVGFIVMAVLLPVFEMSVIAR